MDRAAVLDGLGLTESNSGVYAGGWLPGSGKQLESINPATGEVLGIVRRASADEYEQVVRSSLDAFAEWRMVPAPQRGDYVRRLGNALRTRKAELGALVTMEMGKIIAEGEGEVQEMIDITDFAVGLSRQLYGLTMMSERPRHRMYEQWHPLGPVASITSFNFPVAVWSWNAAIAAVCGDTNVWKPSSMTPLTAVAVTNIAHEVMEGSGFEAVFNLVVGGGADIGEAIVNDHRIPLVSATGSCDMGYKVSAGVARRLGRSILELGGNNAIIVLDDADLDLTVRAALFAAVGTAGQRCTTLRRLIVQRGVVDEVAGRLVDAYGQVRIGDPLERIDEIGSLELSPLPPESRVVVEVDVVSDAKRIGEVILGDTAVVEARDLRDEVRDDVHLVVDPDPETVDEAGDLGRREHVGEDRIDVVRLLLSSPDEVVAAYACGSRDSHENE